MGRPADLLGIGGRDKREERIDENTLLVIREMPGKPERGVKLPITAEQWARYQGGELIQRALPHLSDSQREFIITGMLDEDWDEMFPSIKKHWLGITWLHLQITGKNGVEDFEVDAEAASQPGLLILAPELVDGDFNPLGVSLGFYETTQDHQEGWVGIGWDGCQDVFTRVGVYVNPTHFINLATLPEELWITAPDLSVPGVREEFERSQWLVRSPDLVDEDFNPLGVAVGSIVEGAEWYRDDGSTSDEPGWIANGWDGNSDEPTTVFTVPTHVMEIKTPHAWTSEELEAVQGMRREGC